LGARGGGGGRGAGADVLAHDDGDGGAEGDLAGGGERLQDADGGGGRLDDAGQHGAREHAQDGVGEHEQDVGELRDVLESGDGARHGVHAEHQGGEAQQDHAGVLLLAGPAHHVQDDADERQDRSEGGRLEQLHPDVGAGDAREAEDPGRDGRADVRAHDDVDRLMERHDAGIDEADHHDGRGGGGLDDGGDAEAREKARHLAGGESAEQRLELAAGGLFQGAAHDAHAEEEEAEPADQGESVKNRHTILPRYVFRLILCKA